MYIIPKYIYHRPQTLQKRLIVLKTFVLRNNYLEFNSKVNQ